MSTTHEQEGLENGNAHFGDIVNRCNQRASTGMASVLLNAQAKKFNHKRDREKAKILPSLPSEKENPALSHPEVRCRAGLSPALVYLISMHRSN